MLNQLRAKVGWDLIALTQDWHPEDHCCFYTTHMHNAEAKMGMEHTHEGKRLLLKPIHCVANTHGAEIFGGLTTEPTDFCIRTGQQQQVASQSAFNDADGEPTPLTRLLRSQDITDVYVAGMGSNRAVAETAIDAKKNGFNPFLILGASKGETADAETAARLRTEAQGVGLVSATQLMTASTHPRQQAAAYLEEHKIMLLFERLTTLLVYHKPENPRAFIAEQLSLIQHSQKISLKQIEYLTLFEPTDLEALFRLMDPAESKVVTKQQAQMALSDMRALSDNVAAKLAAGPEEYGLQAFVKLGYEGLSGKNAD
jgi:nicotinamidase/pyrazinamidase